MKKLAIPGKPLFGNDGNLAIRKGELAYVVKDIRAQAHEWNLKGAEARDGLHVKPVVVLGHGNFQCRFAQKEPLASAVLDNLKPPLLQLPTMCPQPADHPCSVAIPFVR